MTKRNPDIDQVAAALSIRPAEVATADYSEHGLEVQTSDGQTYVFPGTGPGDEIHPAEVMFLRPPYEGYRGGFPVLLGEDVPPADAGEVDVAEVAGGGEGEADTEPAAGEAPAGVDLTRSVGEILEAVGDDRGAAEAVRALELEGRRRTTLLRGLAEVIGDEGDD